MDTEEEDQGLQQDTQPSELFCVSVSMRNAAYFGKILQLSCCTGSKKVTAILTPRSERDISLLHIASGTDAASGPDVASELLVERDGTYT